MAPWLGEKVGFFPTSLAGESEAALIAETTDPEKALEFARSQEDVSGPERDYNGTSFQIDSSGDAFGIVDDFLVSATPKGFKRVVDAAQQDSLGDSDQFKDSIGELPDERLATLYAVPRDFLGAIPEEEIDPEGRNIFLKAIGESAETPVLGDLTASAENLELELSAAGGTVETEQSNLLNQLPGEAWLALGLGDIGGAIQNGLDSVESAEVKGLSGEQLRSQLDEATGLDLEQVAQALGGGALFVQGDSTLDLRGALIVQSDDETVSAELLDSLESLISAQAGTSGVRVTSLSSEASSTAAPAARRPPRAASRPPRAVSRSSRRTSPSRSRSSSRTTGSSPDTAAGSSARSSTRAARPAGSPALPASPRRRRRSARSDSTPISPSSRWSSSPRTWAPRTIPASRAPSSI